MSLIIEAVYEAGSLKLLTPLPQLREQERVRLTLETIRPAEDAVRLIAQQRRQRIQIEPQAAREIGDSHEDGLLGNWQGR
jgi:predicted DNA-binding antitoxin AbrB/MazE fold protein